MNKNIYKKEGWKQLLQLGPYVGQFTSLMSRTPTCYTSTCELWNIFNIQREQQES